MSRKKKSCKHLWSDVDPIEPSLNPGYLSTMTWNPADAVRQVKRILQISPMRLLARFIHENGLVDKDEMAADSLRTYITERMGQFKEAGITLHPSSFIIRGRKIHGLATLNDGQRLFLSFFRRTVPPLKAILRYDWKLGVEDPLQIEIGAVDLANLRIFLEKIGTEFAPVAPWGPGIGLGNRMATLDYPAAYEVIQQYGLCAGVIQASVFREMVPERMYHRPDPPLIDLPGIGLIPAGHTGNSIQGQFVAGIVYRIQLGIDLPIVADADHIPIRGTTKRALKDTLDLIKEAQDRTLFTLDPHFCLYGGHPTLQPDLKLLGKIFRRVPHRRQMEILERYEGKEFQVDYLTGKGSFPIKMTREEVVDSAVRFETTINAISNAWDMIDTVRAGRPYAVEVSIDEAPGVTETHHFFYLASELANRSLKPFSLAPGLGFTKKDIDIQGPKESFEERVRQLASIANRFGALLGIHSGDGKSSATRKILAEATGGRFWYKISPDRQRNLFKALSTFPAGTFERYLYEDIFDWTLCHVLRLALETKGETARAAKETINEIWAQETATVSELRSKFEEALRLTERTEDLQSLMDDMERIVRSPSLDLRRDPDSRIIHDYAFLYVGQRDSEGHFLHRGRFFAISEAGVKAYQATDEAYLHELLEALGIE